MNTFHIVFGNPDQFTLAASSVIGERLQADHVVQMPICTRTHLAQAVGELEDQGVNGQVTVLIVTDQSLCLKSLLCMQRTFPELVAAYHVENLEVNIISRAVSVCYIAKTAQITYGKVSAMTLDSVMGLATGTFLFNRFEVTV